MAWLSCLSERLLMLDPRQRIAPGEALKHPYFTGAPLASYSLLQPARAGVHPWRRCAAANSIAVTPATAPMLTSPVAEPSDSGGGGGGGGGSVKRSVVAAPLTRSQARKRTRVSDDGTAATVAGTATVSAFEVVSSLFLSPAIR